MGVTIHRYDTKNSAVVVPASLLIFFILLYMTFKRLDEEALIMPT